MLSLATRARALGRPLLLGHRGAKVGAIENTMSAFARARDAGADGIEFDVRACASGELVVFHDADLARMAGRGEQISTMSWQQLAEVRIGNDERIPSLEQVLAEFHDGTFVLNIEIKLPLLAREVELVDGVLDAVARHGAGEQVVISSFNPRVVARVRRQAPGLACGYLFHQDEPEILQQAWRAPPARPYAVHPEHVLITPARLQRWLQLGFAVVTWTVDREPELQRLAELGVHAIISNDPPFALEVLQRSV